MRMVGRFVIRPREDGQGDLILGACFKGSTLRPGIVYEILDSMGTLTVREVGADGIGMSLRDSHPKLGACWNQDVSTFVDCAGKRFLLTAKELDNFGG